MIKIKDDRGSLLGRISLYKKQQIFQLRFMTAFDFEDPEALLPEEEVWAEFERHLGEEVFDQGFVKTKGEFLAAGVCHTPGGVPAQSCPVSIRVGGVGKTLIVFGDRRWTEDGRISPPAPFTSMPLTWANAFGGGASRENPLGKGLDRLQDSLGQPFTPLPNVELPDRLIVLPEDRPPPACFLSRRPRSLIYPERCGTYDEEWRVEYWPSVPPDFDMDLNQAAMPDQWRRDYFRGGEEVEIRNMHPSEPLIRTRLPRLRLRFFVRRQLAPSVVFNEVNSFLDTVWLFPGRKRGICVWRGMIVVNDPGASDVSHMLAFPEPLDAAPLPPEHYRALAEAAQDEPEAEAPPAVSPATEAAAPAPKAPPDAPEGPPDPALENLRTTLDEARAHLKDLCAQSGIDPGALERVAAAPPEILRDPSQALAGLSATLAASMAELDALLGIEGLEATRLRPAAETSAAAAMAGDAAGFLTSSGASKEELGRFKALIEEGERLTAALQSRAAPPEPEPEPPAPPPPPPSRLTRDQVLAMAARGESLSGLDLSGLDLSGADLSGADLSGAVLESANLCGADLSDADLSDADLTRVRAEGMAAARSRLIRVRAEGLRASSAGLREADLSDADLTGADLSGADLSGAVLNHAVLRSADLVAARCGGCLAQGTDFGEAKAVGADFSRARLSGADFSGAVLDRACLERADARETAFHETSALGAVLRGTELTEAKSCGGACFAEADLSGAGLRNSSWENADFCRSKFGRANLDQASLLGCSLEEADLRLASARQAVMDRSDLSGADASSVNLFKASLRGASLYRCNMEHSNLFSADLFGAVFHETNLRGANLKRTLLANWTPVRC